MLKVLYLPLGEQTGMYDAWKNVGVQLEIFPFYDIYLSNKNNCIAINDQFISNVHQIKPDLLHMQLQITNIIQAETLQKIKQMYPNIIITNWSGDIRSNVIHEFNGLRNVVDYLLISNTGQIGMYNNVGCHNIKYWQIGYDPKKNYPLNYTEFKYDVSFIGNNYGNTFPDGPLREQAVNRCYWAFAQRAGIFGGGWRFATRQVDAKENNEIYNSSVCALSVSNFNNVNHYFSDRLLYCLSSGRPTISWYFPGCESYFAEGSEIFYARKVSDIDDIVNYCKQNPEIAKQIGMNGYKKVLKEHTYTSRVIELLHMINLIDRI
jgi:hypothetical protein